MKKKNGFTLIEVTMAVLIIATITLVAVPIIKTVLNNSKQRAYDITVLSIEEAAKSYHYLNSDTYQTTLDTIGTVNIDIQLLKDDGLIKEDITNPKTDLVIVGYVEVKKVLSAKYEYKFFAQ